MPVGSTIFYGFLSLAIGKAKKNMVNPHHCTTGENSKAVVGYPAAKQMSDWTWPYSKSSCRSCLRTKPSNTRFLLKPMGTGLWVTI